MVREINGNTYSVSPQKQNLRIKSHADISFAQIMSEKTIQPGEVKFSGHAQDRLRDRNITLSPRQIEKLNDTVKQAGEKGAKSSLIVLDNLALIVSIKNKTVITAIDQNSMKDNIFTNIDSAAII
jgi:flagellar operon protein